MQTFKNISQRHICKSNQKSRTVATGRTRAGVQTNPEEVEMYVLDIHLENEHPAYQIIMELVPAGKRKMGQTN